MAGEQLEKVRLLRSKVNKLQAELSIMKKKGLKHDDFIKRKSATGQILQRLNQIDVLLQLDQHSHLSKTGLPNLAHAPRQTVELCNEFLDSRLSITQSVYNELKSLSKWSSEALHRRSMNFLANFRLSQYKKLINQLDSEAIELERQETNQNRAIKFMGSKLTQAQKVSKSDHMELLLTIYDNINTVSARVERLSNRVTKERLKVKNMREWLATNAHYKPKKVLLKSKAIEEAKKLSESAKYNPIKYSEKRLTLARSFVSECLQSSPKRTGKGVHRD